MSRGLMSPFLSRLTQIAELMSKATLAAKLCRAGPHSPNYENTNDLPNPP